MFEDSVVELRLSFGVEGETADLAFGFTAGGQVAVVFRSSGTDFDDVVAWVEFIGEIAEKITERGFDGRIVGSLDEDNFFLEFEPRVDVLGKESDLRVGKMVDLMNVKQAVAFLEVRARWASV